MTPGTKTAWIVGGLLVLSGGVVSSIAFLGPGNGGADPTPPPEYHSGEVLTVDAAANRITLREGLGRRAAEVKIRVTPDTRIVHAGEPMALDDVHAGDHAIVRMRLPSPADARDAVAQEIHVASAGDPADDESSSGDDDSATQTP